LAALAAILSTGACGVFGDSPEARFYTLRVEEPAEASPDRDGRGSFGAPVGIADVEIPPTLDRPQIVRVGQGGEVAVLDLHRWAGPVDIMIRRTLAQNLASRLPAGAVVLPGQPKPQEAMRNLVVVFSRFGAGPGDTIALDATWSVVPEEGAGARFDRRARIEVPLDGGTPGDIVDGMNVALGRLAGRIATSLGKAGGAAT
jgi:hypothetical protein